MGVSVSAGKGFSFADEFCKFLSGGGFVGAFALLSEFESGGKGRRALGGGVAEEHGKFGDGCRKEVVVGEPGEGGEATRGGEFEGALVVVAGLFVRDVDGQGGFGGGYARGRGEFVKSGDGATAPISLAEASSRESPGVAL